MNPGPKTSTPKVYVRCEVAGCRSIACGKRPICRVCAGLITRKESQRFMAAVGAANKLRYFETILLPTIARRHEQRGRN